MEDRKLAVDGSAVRPLMTPMRLVRLEPRRRDVDGALVAEEAPEVPQPKPGGAE
jgi:hypothetical protein